MDRSQKKELPYKGEHQKKGRAEEKRTQLVPRARAASFKTRAEVEEEA